MKRPSAARAAALGVALCLLAMAGIERFAFHWSRRSDVVSFRDGQEPPRAARQARARRVRWATTGSAAAAVVLAALLAGVVTGRVLRRRLVPLAEALERVARGDFHARLPHVAVAELRPVRDAFGAMTAALDQAFARLSFADAQRRRLFADLAHELATPASAIAGLVDTLARPELAPTERDRTALLVALEGEAARLSRLVRDVHELAALDDPEVSVQREPVDVAGATRALVEQRALAAGALCFECETEAAWATADGVRLEQVLVNLLHNAERHTPAGGTVRVRVARRGARVEIVVEDSGPGVPDAALARLGERLFRVDPSRDRRTGGHGLGLAIARSIVHRHGGDLRFERSDLGGLRALVSLEALEAPGPGGAARATS